MYKDFKSIQKKDSLKIVQKINLWESYDAHRIENEVYLIP